MNWVLDTNVLVSSLLKEGTPPRQLVEKAVEKAFACVVSDDILAEYKEVFARPKFKIKPEHAQALLDFMSEGIRVSGKRPAQRLPDSKDQPFLDAALEADAEAIVTGNAADFPDKVCAPVKIFSPVEALKRLGPGRKH